MSVGSNTTKTPFKGGLKAIVDTGASFILLPQKYVDVYYKSAPFVINHSYEGYIFPCNKTLPDLNLQIGCYSTTIPGYLMRGASVNKTSKYISRAIERLEMLTMCCQPATQAFSLPTELKVVQKQSLEIAFSRPPSRYSKTHLMISQV